MFEIFFIDYYALDALFDKVYSQWRKYIWWSMIGVHVTGIVMQARDQWIENISGAHLWC